MRPHTLLKQRWKESPPEQQQRLTDSVLDWSRYEASLSECLSVLCFQDAEAVEGSRRRRVPCVRCDGTEPRPQSLGRQEAGSVRPDVPLPAPEAADDGHGKVSQPSAGSSPADAKVSGCYSVTGVIFSCMVFS